jgi:drug/metabolite transporter (DMT)-like permease
MLGVAFAILSAFSFSVNSIFARRGLATAAASAGAYITVLLGAFLFLLASGLSGQLFQADEVSWRGFALLAAAGVIHFGVGRYCNYRAANAIGATRTGPVQAFAIPYAILFAFVFLEESITWAMAAAISMIMIGPAVMVERRRTPGAAGQTSPRGASDVATGFQPRQKEGYTFALLSVVAYGTSPVLIRAALADADDLAIFGGFIAYASAAVVLTLTLLHPGRRGLLSAMNFRSVKLFLGAGFFVFFAQMFRFIALSLAPVAVITPLMRTGELFTLGLSWAVNRHLEKITWRVVLGILVSASGSALLVVVRQ